MRFLIFLIELGVRAQENTQENIHKKTFEISNEWEGGFEGRIHAQVPWSVNTTSGWTLELTFVGTKLAGFDCWNANIENQKIDIKDITTTFTLKNLEWNGNLRGGEYTDIGFQAKLEGEDKPPKAIIKFNDVIVFNEMDPNFSYDPGQPPPPEVVEEGGEEDSVGDADNDEGETDEKEEKEKETKVTSVMIPGLREELEDIVVEEEVVECVENANSTTNGTETTCGEVGPTPFSDSDIKELKYNYKEILQKSILFYEAQRSGKLPEKNRIPWRKDSCLWDGEGKGINGTDVDLTGGYYDAGDNLKFGFPLSFSLTTLAWGALHYWDAYVAAEEMNNMIDLLLWGGAWLEKATILDSKGIVQAIYVLVGDPEYDHGIWNGPENIKKEMPRPVFKVNLEKAGTDVAADYAAAFAAMGLVYKKAEEKELFKNDERNRTSSGTTEFRDKYSDSVPEVAVYYKSSDYRDEVVWGGIWLYRATGKMSYYELAKKRYYNWDHFQSFANMFSWDNKVLGCQLLLAQVTRDDLRENYIDPLHTYCKKPDKGEAKFTEKGLLFIMKWAPLRYAANSAFLCLMASEYSSRPDSISDFAVDQVNYILGENKFGGSFVIGYGKKYPTRPHHRASSCPGPGKPCGDNYLNRNDANPNLLLGALVGGPDSEDNFKDDRKDYIQNEVALDYNAAYQGLMAGMLHKELIKKPIEVYSNIKNPMSTNQKSYGSSSSKSSYNFIISSSSIFLFVFLII
ncbi:unnamed protein product [Oikopleura dioica]|uniref:Endoglucanase n=1 Tax=Oikopleura dioica TaxID=34765 RepID=E4WXU7_OIKDI|nr:unnamed protein product [Oikopleura dioica]